MRTTSPGPRSHDLLEERMDVHLLGTVGVQLALRVRTQQLRDEVPSVLPHFIGELERIIHDPPVCLRGILYTIHVGNLPR
jgi:hypothetical protein